MKITRRTGKKVAINQVEAGQTFICEGDIYIMCRYEGDDICCPRCDENIAISEEIECLAVNLSSGAIYNFYYYTEVTLTECEVVEI